MSRLSLALVMLVGILAGGLGVSLLRPQPVSLSDTDVRTIVTGMLEQDRAKSPMPMMNMAQLDAAKVNTLIENYLMSDPTILTRMNDKLNEQKHVAERAAEKAAIDAHSAEIYQASDNVILGNPKGDVTLVEMFDYNCSYCRGALPDMAALLAEDPNLKVILRQFPILTSGSVDAAKVAVLVAENPKINYWDFHQRLFASRGEVGADQALEVAEELGGDKVAMMLNMNGSGPEDAIQKTYDLARALNIGGTPTYILGDEMIPGALPVEQLKAKIANLRACGSTECPAAGAG